ncbi:telomeric repeat-binding factor, partial [Trifolium medium]|nr:telomeric repeat-binding factor [Trifolium medium]
ASLIKDMYAAIVDDGSRDTTTSCSKIASMPIDEDSKIGESLQCSSMELENQELEDMNQEAHSEYHNANSYVANSQDDCQSINNNEANLKEAARSHEGGTTSNTVGVTLRRSKRKNFSPLKDHEPTEVTKRRRRNKWSESEVDNLRAGVL